MVDPSRVFLLRFLIKSTVYLLFLNFCILFSNSQLLGLTLAFSQMLIALPLSPMNRRERARKYQNNELGAFLLYMTHGPIYERMYMECYIFFDQSVHVSHYSGS